MDNKKIVRKSIKGAAKPVLKKHYWLLRLSSSKGFLSAIVNKLSSGGVYVLFYTAKGT